MVLHSKMVIKITRMPAKGVKYGKRRVWVFFHDTLCIVQGIPVVSVLVTGDKNTKHYDIYYPLHLYLSFIMQNYKKQIDFIGILETFKQNLVCIDVYYNLGPRFFFFRCIRRRNSSSAGS